MLYDMQEEMKGTGTEIESWRMRILVWFYIFPFLSSSPNQELIETETDDNYEPIFYFPCSLQVGPHWPSTVYGIWVTSNPQRRSTQITRIRFKSKSKNRGTKRRNSLVIDKTGIAGVVRCEFVSHSLCVYYCTLIYSLKLWIMNDQVLVLKIIRLWQTSVKWQSLHNYLDWK